MVAMALWSAALAWDVGGSEISAVRQGIDRRALAHARAWFWGTFPSRKSPRKTVFADKEGYPHLV